jgi:hypothetical protein
VKNSGSIHQQEFASGLSFKLAQEAEANIIQVKGSKCKVVPVLKLGNQKNIFIPFI